MSSRPTVDDPASHGAYFAVLDPEDEPRLVPLHAQRAVVGSAPEADIRLMDSEVDPHHAEVRALAGAGYVIEGRRAPLFVNGHRVAVQPLQHGDLICVGRSALSFRQGKAAAGGGARDAFEADLALPILRRLFALSRRLYEGDRMDAVTEQVLTDVVELTAAEQGMLVLFEGAGSLRTVGARTASSGSFDAQELQLSRTAVAKIQEDPRPRLWTDISADPDLALAPSIHRAGVRCLMASPIMLGDEPMGVLYLARRAGSGLFSGAQLDLLAVYAAQVALMLASASWGRELSMEVEQIRRDLETVRSQQIWGSSSALRRLLERVGKVARSSISVLITGETGTGKELFAREIHRLSDRAGGPFVPVNCGAIPAPLLESELFGHVRGAFTDATKDRVGKLRSASGGTLFLDEIGEMPLDQQAKLLRVLEERSVTPVGGDQSQEADFRLVCATNQRLEQRVSSGQFRRDLYYRVADFVLEVPPLREREDDAVELARLFVKRHAVLLGRPEVRLSASAMTAIRNHRWDGNVRELEAAVKRAIVVAEGELIQPVDFDLPGDAGSEGVLPLARARDEFLKGYVRRVVEDCGGNRSAAARILEVTPRTIFKYLEEV